MLLLAIFDPWQDDTQVASRHLVPAGMLASLARIEYRDSGQRHAAQRDAQGYWQSVLPETGAANEDSIGQLVAALGFVRVLRRVKLEEFHGVHSGSPQLLLTTSVGDTLAISFGNTDGKHRWVRLGQAEQALLVEAYLLDEVILKATSLRSRRLFSWTLDTATPFRLTVGRRWTEFGSAQVRWSEEGTAIVEVSADSGKQRELLQALQDLRADTKDCVRSTEFILGQGEHTALISAGHCVAVDLWRVVRAALERPEQFARLNLLPSTEPDDVSIQCRDRRVDVQRAMADPTVLAKWWRQVDGLATALVPTQHLQLHCVLMGAGWRVEIGSWNNTWYAQFPQHPYMLRLTSEARSLVDVGPEAFLSRLLIEEEAIFARRIEIVEGAKTRILYRGEVADSWGELGANTINRKTATLATEMARALGMLQAERFGKSEEDSARQRLIEVVFDDPLGEAQIHHSLNLRGSIHRCMVSVDAQPWAELSTKTCAALWAQ